MNIKKFNITHLETNKNYTLSINFDKNTYNVNTKKKIVLNDLKNDIEINFNNMVYNLGTNIMCTYPYLETILFRYEKI